MPHRPADASKGKRFVDPHALGRSTLRASALQRLAYVATPIALLWLFVAFALDRFA